MNNKTITIILVVVVVALLYYLFGRTPNNNPNANSTQVEDSLRQVIHSYENKQKNYDSTLVLLNHSVDSLNGLLEKNRQDLVNLKNKLHEKNTIIGNFSSTDIYKYLSNRYPAKSKSSIRDTTR